MYWCAILEELDYLCHLCRLQITPEHPRSCIQSIEKSFLHPVQLDLKHHHWYQDQHTVHILFV
ncbi:hypothetical protein AALO_G00006920, partial [Alosa alosa]